MKCQRITGLKLHNEKFDANITLKVEYKKDIYWWINNKFQSFAPVNIPDPDITIYIDTSLIGWDIGKTPSENTLNRELGRKRNYSHKCVRIGSNSIWCINLLQG